MRTINKLLILLLTLLLPKAVTAGPYDGEDGDPGVIPDNSGDIPNNTLNCTANPTAPGCVNPSGVGDQAGAGQGGNLTIIVGGTNIMSYPGVGSLPSPQQLFIQQQNSVNSVTASNAEQLNAAQLNADILNELTQDFARDKKGASIFNLENGIFSLTVPTVHKGAVIEKTVALGIPEALYVSQEAFLSSHDKLTTEGEKFFNQIPLKNSDIAVVIGMQTKANTVAAQLIKNGANKDQIVVVPAIHKTNPNTVAVFVVRLPTMADLFVPTKTDH